MVSVSYDDVSVDSTGDKPDRMIVRYSDVGMSARREGREGRDGRDGRDVDGLRSGCIWTKATVTSAVAKRAMAPY
jgi:hypothetical protein